MHDAASEQAYPATLPCIGDASFPYRLSQDVVSGIGNPCLYANPLYGEPQTKKEETAQRHVISDYKQQQSPRFVVMTSRGLPFECDDNITDYIFGLTTNTFSARDGGSPSIEGCVAEILCPLLSNGLSV